jgi:hypothetical protein
VCHLQDAPLLRIPHSNHCHWLMYCSWVDAIDKKQIIHVGVIYKVKIRFYMKTRYVCPSVCGLVSVNKLSVGFSLNTVQNFL